MYSKIFSGAALGIGGMLITVESDISMGLPGFCLVGYLASSVKEAGDRVRTALKNSGYSIPSRRITVNLSPADVRKEGAGFDLAIAISILISMGEFSISSDFRKQLDQTIFLGELGLDGRVLPINGVLPIVDYAAENGIKRVVLPSENAREASYIKNLEIIPVNDLVDITQIVRENKWSDTFHYSDIQDSYDTYDSIDFADIRGQETMKRGVVIAVAGFHNILMTGAAGSGKSMIAKCIPGIMPPLTYEESKELTKVYSVAGKLDSEVGLIKRRPFRSPGQNVSENALLGGGRDPKPGEISLATGGVLFLDEFPEYSRSVIESLRQPMEDKEILISRIKGSYTFQARFMLVAARNNCPCGFYPDRTRCKCNAREIYNYQNRLSHPIMDRIDIRLEISPVRADELFGKSEGMNTEKAREIIQTAREMQNKRYKDESFKFNSEIPQNKIDKYIRLGMEEEKMVKNYYEESGISARGYYRILRLARTIADINGREEINTIDIEEATFFRNENGGKGGLC